MLSKGGARPGEVTCHRHDCPISRPAAIRAMAGFRYRQFIPLQRSPKPDLLINILPAEQAEMRHGAPDPLMRHGKSQGAAGVFMLTQRAVDRHKAIAQKSVAQAAAPVPG